MRKLLPILTFLLILCLPTWAWGAVYHVDANGDDGDGRTTLSWVNTNMVEGDIAYLYDDDGTFTTAIEPNNDGTSGSPITYVAASGEVPNVTASATNSCYINDKDYIVVDGITFGSTVYKAVYILNGNYNVIRNCIAQDRTLGFVGYYAMHIKGTASPGSSYNLIQNCTVGDANHSSIMIEGWSHDLAQYNVVRLCSVNNTAHYGIHTNKARRTLIEYNDIQAGSVPLSAPQSTPPDQSRTACCKDDYALYSISQDDLLRWNVIHDSDGGLFVGGNAINFGNRIVNNTFYNNAEADVFSNTPYDYRDFAFKNNIFFNPSGYENADGDGSSIDCLGTGDPNQCDAWQLSTASAGCFFWQNSGATDYNDYIDGNLFTPGSRLTYWQNTYCSYTIWSLSTDPSSTSHPDYLNSTKCSNDWGPDNIVADPNLSNPSYNDYTLSGNSPCIDAGAFLTTITSDTQGAPGATSFVVDDPLFFSDGWGISVLSGDTIKTENGQSATITDINYTTGAVTVDAPITWTQGEGIALDYVDEKPDIGADEYGKFAQDFDPQISASSVSPQNPANGGTLTYSITATDPEGKALTYSWTINGTQFSTSASSTYDLPAAYDDSTVQIKCTVCDPGPNCVNTPTYNITVGTTAGVTETWGENSGNDYNGVTEDTLILASQATTNFSTYDFVRAANYGGTDYDYKGLITFDLSGISDETITDSKLTLFIKGMNASTACAVRAYTCTVADQFTPSQATWNVKSTGNNWTVPHGEDTLVDTETLPAGTAQYTAVTFDGADLDTYINSKQAGTAYFVLNTDSASHADFYTEEGPNGYRPTLYISRGEAAVTGSVLTGDATGHSKLDNGALTREEITDNDTFWTNNNTVTNDTEDYIEGDACGVFELDNGEYLSRAGETDVFNWDSTEECTVCLRWKAQSSTAAGYLFSKGGNNKWDYRLVYNADSTISMHIGYDGGDKIDEVHSHGTACSDGEWHGGCFPYRGSDKAWKIGARRASDDALLGGANASGTGTNVKTWGEDGVLNLGATGGGFLPFDGKIDEFVAFDRFLSDDEIDAYYFQELPLASVSSWSPVLPVLGGTVQEAGTVRVASIWDKSVTFTNGGANPTAIVTDGSHETTVTLESANGTNSTVHLWSGALAALTDGALSIKAGSITLNGGTLTYGANSINANTTLTLTALGIYGDVAGGTVVSNEWCESDGTDCTEHQTVTSAGSIYNHVVFSEAQYFKDGSLSTLYITSNPADYGTVTLYPSSSQPSGWGVGTVNWLYKAAVSEGDRGLVTLGAEINNDEAILVDAGGNEVSDYSPQATTYTMTFEVPASADAPFTVKATGGTATTKAGVETACGASGLLSGDYIFDFGSTENYTATVAGVNYWQYGVQTGTFDCDSLAITIRGTNRITGAISNTDNATLLTYKFPARKSGM